MSRRLVQFQHEYHLQRGSGQLLAEVVNGRRDNGRAASFGRGYTGDILISILLETLIGRSFQKVKVIPSGAFYTRGGGISIGLVLISCM